MVIITCVNPFRHGFFHISHISHDPRSLVGFSNSSTVFNAHSSYFIAFCGGGAFHPSAAAEREHREHYSIRSGFDVKEKCNPLCALKWYECSSRSAQIIILSRSVMRQEM